MPYYDYACKGCDNEFSAKHSIADRNTPCGTPCEKCSGQIYMRLSSPRIVGGVKGPQSAPDGFKDILREIKKGSGKGCTIDV